MNLLETALSGRRQADDTHILGKIINAYQEQAVEIGIIRFPRENSEFTAQLFRVIARVASERFRHPAQYRLSYSLTRRYRLAS